jgi:hypothetical protein
MVSVLGKLVVVVGWLLVYVLLVRTRLQPIVLKGVGGFCCCVVC